MDVTIPGAFVLAGCGKSPAALKAERIFDGRFSIVDLRCFSIGNRRLTIDNSLGLRLQPTANSPDP